MEKSKLKKPKNITEYIAGFPTEVQKPMNELRSTIMKAAPGAEEVISYGIPAFKLDGMLVYFAAYANHIGFYPTPSGIEKFKKELSAFKTSKGAVQFPHNKPLPLDLIARIVSFRTKENLQKTEMKGRIKK